MVILSVANTDLGRENYKIKLHLLKLHIIKLFLTKNKLKKFRSIKTDLGKMNLMEKMLTNNHNSSSSPW